MIKGHFFQYAFFSLLLLLPNCSEKPLDKNPQLKIAALLKSSTNPFFNLMWEGIKSEADKLNLQVELFWPESESNFDYQYEFLKTQARFYDALIIAPSNPNQIYQYLPVLKEQKILIAILDIDFDLPEEEKSKYYDVFIGTDDSKGGILAAEFAKGHLLPNNQKVVVFDGFDFHKNIPRLVSFREKLRLYLPNIKFLEFVGDYDRDKARQITNDNISVIREANVVYCANDHMALGVIDSLLAKGLKKMPVIIGYDSVREAQEAILEGNLAASVIQFPAKMGSEGIKTLFALSKGVTTSRKILIDPELSVKKSFITSLKVMDLVRKGNKDNVEEVNK